MAEEMRLAEEFSVHRLGPEPSDEDVDTAPPEVELLRNGRSTGVRLAGAILEAAVAYDGGLIVFLTNDCPFEERLNVYLLSGDMELLDSARFVWMYSTGAFEELELVPPRTVRFRFFGDTTWSVEALDKPGFRFPFVSEPAGVFRRFGFRRHFIVRGKPKPEGRP